MTQTPPWSADEVRALAEEMQDMDGPLIPILHAVQAKYGYVPTGAYPALADALNLSVAEVHGVVEFYQDFRTTPPGRHVVKLCRAEACQSMNGENLAAHARRHLGIGFHETTPDRSITLEPVYCLGNCMAAPAMMADGDLHGRVDAARFDDIVGDLEKRS